jgi:chorismate mutase
LKDDMTSTLSSELRADEPRADEPRDEQAPATGAVPVPADQAGIDTLRLEIDDIDAELVRLIQRRTALSNAIGAARKQLGGPRIVYSREMAILERFRDLGPAGTDLGMMLLAMGRGKLGRRPGGPAGSVVTGEPDGD